MSKTYTASELKLTLADAKKREANARKTRAETAQELLTILADLSPKLADKALAKLQRFADHARKSYGAPAKPGARHRRAESSSRSQKRDDGVSQCEAQADAAAGPQSNAKR